MRLLKDGHGNILFLGPVSLVAGEVPDHLKAFLQHIRQRYNLVPRSIYISEEHPFEEGLCGGQDEVASVELDILSLDDDVTQAILLSGVAGKALARK